ncbi:MAG: hypothetical protein Fur0022_09460 [Anaerolineales bacterium]
MESSNFFRVVRFFMILAIGALAFSAFSTPKIAQAEPETPDVPTGLSEYYIPVEADQLWSIFVDNDNDPVLNNAQGIHYVIAVTASTDNTTVYYDHWEDTYDFNEVTLTGADESFTANQGTVLEFESNNVPAAPRGTGMNVCTSTHPPGSTATNFCYDGRDRIYVVGGAATVTLAVWPQSQGTVYAFAWELFPTKPYQTGYTIPVGENLFGAPYFYDDFDNVYVLAQATTDGTTIQIDDPQTGPGADVTANLNKGEVTQLWHIWSGTTVTANFPIQVQFIVGQAQAGAGAETRGFTVVPASLWDDEYYAPVDGSVGANGSEIYIYNPNASSITITWADSSGTGSFSLAGGATVAYSDPAGANHAVPVNSGVRLSGTDLFWGVGSVDTEDYDYDWNYSLVPASALTSEYYVGWAPGTSDATPVNNCSPVWITAQNDNTILQIDYGPTDGTFDFTTTVDQLDSLRVYDPDFDNSGMHIVSSAPIAVAWGEADLNQAGSSCAITSPNMDLGYTVLPQLQSFIDVVLNLEKTANPAIISNAAGQTSEFTLVVNTENYAVDDVDVEDLLPANWAYVDDSTIITFPDNSSLSGNSADPSISGQTLTWDLNLDVAANETLTIVFTAITTAAPGTASVNFAESTGTYNGNTFTSNDTALVDLSALQINKKANINGIVYPGDTIEYTIVITNGGTTTQNDLVVTDTLPTGTSYVAQSTNVTFPAPSTTSTYLDQFGTASYSNSNGTATWSTSWTEGGAESGNNPSAGFITIGGGELRFDGTGISSCASTPYTIQRAANLAGVSSATLTYTYQENGTNEAEDTITVEVWDGSAWNTVETNSGEFGTVNATENITAYANASTIIRFSVTCFDDGGTPQERLDIDNVQIQYTIPGAVTTKDNVPGGGNDLVDGTPPNLVLAGDNIDISASSIMTVTYQVTVLNPAGVTSIDNTVYVSSVEEPTPLTDSTTNPLPLSAIGDRVWLDEDGDGVQDAGEAGIPNVTVELRDGICTPGSTCPTTMTDSEGNYIFTGLASGNYTIAVISGLPAGLSAHPTYDEDGTGTPNTSTVPLGTGEEYVTADFGYNWAPTTDVTNPTPGATGAIGDRVWIDADGDGNQDPGEAGLSGVSVALITAGPDGIFGTTDDVTAATTTTDAAGNYIFDGLAAGAYRVQVTAPGGYTQTGDPDATLDHQTTDPIVLAPGDVYVNADFGYQPTGATNTIGNQIFVDVDGNGSFGGSDRGIPGVTVALLDNGGNVIATTITDANGQYSFPGLPNGTYTIWVNDTSNVLGSLVQTSTPNNSADNGQACGFCNQQNTVTVSGSGSSFQDFGYAPSGHGSGDGLIGDTIFLDRNGNGTPEVGEGLEGVRVDLFQDTNGDGNYDAGEPRVGSTLTDENGNYYFGNLPAGNYVVQVNPSTLPAGVTNTVDVGDPTLNEGGVALAAGGINLNQNFGYRDLTNPNTISGTIWNDTDADGTLEGTETARFAGVTVALYDSNGNLVATTITDSNGDYSFTGLPDGTYTVDVTDTGNTLNGYWHSTGPSAGADNNSQSDPYTVTVAGGATNTTADFGYYVDPASVGDFVWLDRNNDGIQDANEPGIKGILVTLTVVYPNGDTASFSTITGANGYYSFGNLLLDENYNVGDNTPGNPNYTITFSTPPGATPSPTGAGTPSTDSNGTSTVLNPIIEGQTDTTYDSGFFTIRLDLGDLPAGYPTLFSPGPAHTIFPDTDSDGNPNTTGGVPAVWLGLSVDIEGDGQPSANADGDGADEDGLDFAPSGWIAGQSSTVTITLNSDASAVTVYFGLWFDWNGDNVFEAFYSGSGVSSSPVNVPVTINVPVTYTPTSNVYIRLRAHDDPLTSADYQGTLVNGEVEDYRIAFSPTAITLASLSVRNSSNLAIMGALGILVLGGTLFLLKRRNL